MYQNVHFLDHFFALLDFGSRDEERRTRDEGRRRTEDRQQCWMLDSRYLILDSAFGGLSLAIKGLL